MKQKKKRIVPQPAKTTDDIQKLANRLKSLRIEKGFTSYEAFANEFGLSRALYGRYEKGKDLRYSSLVKIVKALDMTLEEFFSDGFE